jgi:DNA (cytosine-5)-methyltransferase 1
MLTVGSLFSGIGGLDLGLERAGFKVIWQSEIDPYCNKVLKKHWPEVPNHGNIKEIDWSTIKRPNVICGGYPCQPFSLAGRRQGTDDPRHLWPWVRTAISELRPDYALLENVRGHLTMGGIEVIGELAEIGYDAEWRIVSAAGVGAPHRRDRLIIVAYPAQLFSDGVNNNARGGLEPEAVSELGNSGRASHVAYPNDTRGRTPERGINTVGASEVQERENVAQFGASGRGTNVANTPGEQGNGRQPRSDYKEPTKKGLQEQIRASGTNVANTDSEQLGQRRESQHAGQARAVWKHNGTGQARYDGWQWWEVEPDVGRVADGVPHRVDRLRGLGNAVVPQVAEYIGHLIMAAHNNA